MRKAIHDKHCDITHFSSFFLKTIMENLAFDGKMLNFRTFSYFFPHFTKNPKLCFRAICQAVVYTLPQKRDKIVCLLNVQNLGVNFHF